MPFHVIFRKTLLYSDFQLYHFLSYSYRNYGLSRQQPEYFSGGADVCNKDIVRLVPDMDMGKTEMYVIKVNLMPFSAFYGNAPFLKLQGPNCNSGFIKIKPAAAVKDTEQGKQK